MKAQLDKRWMPPVGSSSISSIEKEGPDITAIGCRWFPRARGITCDIISKDDNSKPLLTEKKGKFTGTCSDMLFKKSALYCA